MSDDRPKFVLGPNARFYRLAAGTRRQEEVLPMPSDVSIAAPVAARAQPVIEIDYNPDAGPDDADRRTFDQLVRAAADGTTVRCRRMGGEEPLDDWEDWRVRRSDTGSDLGFTLWRACDPEPIDCVSFSPQNADQFEAPVLDRLEAYLRESGGRFGVHRKDSRIEALYWDRTDALRTQCVAPTLEEALAGLLVQLPEAED